jgi:hypothetical protein
MPAHSVVCTDLSFHRPDGTPVLDHLDTAFDTAHTGLVGLTVAAGPPSRGSSPATCSRPAAR